MGDTCSACHATNNQQEIKAVVLGEDKENHDDVVCGSSEKVCQSTESLQNSKKSSCEARHSNKSNTLKSSQKSEKKVEKKTGATVPSKTDRASDECNPTAYQRITGRR